MHLLVHIPERPRSSHARLHLCALLLFGTACLLSPACSQMPQSKQRQREAVEQQLLQVLKLCYAQDNTRAAQVNIQSLTGEARDSEETARFNIMVEGSKTLEPLLERLVTLTRDDDELMTRVNDLVSQSGVSQAISSAVFGVIRRHAPGPRVGFQFNRSPPNPGFRYSQLMHDQYGPYEEDKPYIGPLPPPFPLQPSPGLSLEPRCRSKKAP